MHHSCRYANPIKKRPRWCCIQYRDRFLCQLGVKSAVSGILGQISPRLIKTTSTILLYLPEKALERSISGIPAKRDGFFNEASTLSRSHRVVLHLDKWSENRRVRTKNTKFCWLNSLSQLNCDESVSLTNPSLVPLSKERLQRFSGVKISNGRLIDWGGKSAPPSNARIMAPSASLASASSGCEMRKFSVPSRSAAWVASVKS